MLLNEVEMAADSALQAVVQALEAVRQMPPARLVSLSLLFPHNILWRPQRRVCRCGSPRQGCAWAPQSRKYPCLGVLLVLVISHDTSIL